MPGPVETVRPQNLDDFGQWRTWRPAGVAVSVAAVAFLLIAALAGSSAPLRQTNIAGTPCPAATPGVGTPVPTADDAPAFVDVDSLCGEVTEFGTPIAAGELTVTIEADRLTAGPRELTVVIVDGAGQPVTDASVTIRTRSLEMDHGVSVDETVQTEPGRYFAERVSLGMGGDWLTEITIERSGADPVVL